MFFDEKKRIKNAKIILNNSKLQLKDIAYTIRNKLKDLLTELKGFKFVTILVLEFKK